MEFEQDGRTYGKTMEFSLWREKKCVLSLKNGGGGGGGDTFRLRNVVSMFVASVITSVTSPGLALQTSRSIAIASAE